MKLNRINGMKKITDNTNNTKPITSIYNIKIKTVEGKEISLDEFKGKKLEEERIDIGNIGSKEVWSDPEVTATGRIPHHAVDIRYILPDSVPQSDRDITIGRLISLKLPY